MALALGLLAAATIGLSDLFGRRVVLASSALTAAATMQIFAALTAAAFALATSSSYDARGVVFGCLSGLGMGAGLGLYYTGLQHSTATIVSPLVATLSALIPFSYAAFRGSPVSALAVGGAVLAVAGLVLITSGAISPERLRAGVLWGLLAGLGYGFAGATFVEAATSDSWWPSVAQRCIGFLLLSAVALSRSKPPFAPSGQRVNAMLAGSLTGVVSIAYLGALAIDPTVGVVAIATFPAFSVIVGRVFFSDAVQTAQIAGIGLVIAGVAAVALG